MNSKFGWSYPPGAANDPNAPYNQVDDYDEDEDMLKFTPEQEALRKELHNKIWEYTRKTDKPPLAKLEDITEFLPEGDFKWDDTEAGDWHVYCCGEKDCPVQWHTVAYTEEFERKDGKLSITLHSVDSDGNWDVDGGWEEGEDFEKSDVAYALGQNRMDDYFKSWAEYWIDAAETGNDPCDQIMKKVAPAEWVDFCLDAAADNVKYLTKEHG